MGGLGLDPAALGGQGETARWAIVAVGCGPGLRLFRSKPPDPRLHRHGWHKSRRLASSSRIAIIKSSFNTRILAQLRAPSRLARWPPVALPPGEAKRA